MIFTWDVQRAADACAEELAAPLHLRGPHGPFEVVLVAMLLELFRERLDCMEDGWIGRHKVVEGLRIVLWANLVGRRPRRGC